MIVRKRFILTSLLLFAGLFTWAQEKVEKEEEAVLDIEEVIDEKSFSKPNNYWLAGVYGGVSFNYGMFNPTRYNRWQMQYPVAGFSFIRYYTMFNMFPTMGLEFGAQLNHEGYEMKANKETGYHLFTDSGAYKVNMKVPEVFFLTHFHGDFAEHLKVMFKIGLYAGYRIDIHRFQDEKDNPTATDLTYTYSFRDYDKRASYGVLGGIGFGLMFDPFEIHIMAQGKWGWGSFWNADYYNKWYYRFGYPLDAGVTIGLYYQLTPRYGHTRGQLRKLARKIVQEENVKN